MASTVAKTTPSINPTQDIGPLITMAAAVAGTIVGNKQSNSKGRGVTVSANVTAITGSIVVNIYADDDASGGKKLLLASASIAGTGFTQYVVYPGTVAAANLVANMPLPASWHVEVVITTGPCTGTISASVTA